MITRVLMPVAQKISFIWSFAKCVIPDNHYKSMVKSCLSCDIFSPWRSCASVVTVGSRKGCSWLPLFLENLKPERGREFKEVVNNSRQMQNLREK